MPPRNLEKLTRTLHHEGREVVVMRPGITFAMYSRASLADAMAATDGVLEAYLAFVPSGAIVSSYQGGPDEHTPGRWTAFDQLARLRLGAQLRAGVWEREDEGYGFVLASTADGQAGAYGVRFGGIDLAAADSDEHETSLLRLDFPWNFLDSVDVEAFVGFVERCAAVFPFCSGNAGLAFTHNIAYVPEAREEIGRLWPRFLGFDVASDSSQLRMNGRSPAAHWITLLDRELVTTLGGETALRAGLTGCDVRRVTHGILIRAAKFPPVIDVNRGGVDIGRLSVVADVLKPIRLDDGLFVGLRDDDTGAEWLRRLDGRPPGDWNNG